MRPTDERVVRKAMTGNDVALAAFDRIVGEAALLNIDMERVSLFNYGATHCKHRELGAKCLAQVTKSTCSQGHQVAVA